MIDQDLIKSGSMHLKSMLASLSTDHNGLILIEDVFTDQNSVDGQGAPSEHPIT